MRFKRVVDVVQYLTLGLVALTVAMLFIYDPAPSTGSGSSGAPATTLSPTLVEAGSGVFADNCSRCHGSQGQGGVGPKLAGEVVDNYPVPADEAVVVTEGREGMPAFGATLTDEQIEAVVAYTRSL